MMVKPVKPGAMITERAPTCGTPSSSQTSMRVAGRITELWELEQTNGETSFIFSDQDENWWNLPASKFPIYVYTCQRFSGSTTTVRCPTARSVSPGSLTIRVTPDTSISTSAVSPR